MADPSSGKITGKICDVRLSELRSLATSKEGQFQRFIKKAEKTKGRDLDDLINGLHQEYFSKINCIDCANCCRTTPALLRQDDMERLSRVLNLSKGEFISRYVIMDEDGDFVTNSTPCPFLSPDGKCSVYDDRPASCRQYPHTSQSGQKKILNVSLANTSICPAVYRIFDKLSS